MLKQATIIAIGLIFPLIGPATRVAHAQQPFAIQQRWSVPGEGGWDYLTADSATHRLYIAHGTRVDVLDTTSGKVLGAISGLTRCHGIVISPDGKTGFISDGGANKVIVFDPATLATTGEIPAGTNPDGMVYERSTGTLWAFNGTSKNVTVIDALARKTIATIPLSGKPEFPVSDDHGTVFVNIEDKNTVMRLDANAKKVTATWPLAGCDSPSGQAIDTAGARLFAVCDGKKMVVTDAHTGKLLATSTIGEGPDATAYDPRTKLAFASNGDGTLSIVDTSKPNYPVIQTLPTMKGARTIALDPSNGTIYTVSAKFGATPASTAATPHPRPAALPGSFTVLVIGTR